MSVTVLEALQSAKCNLMNVPALGKIAVDMAQEQLKNAVGLLEKGYCINSLVEPLLEKHGDIENVPEKTQS